MNNLFNQFLNLIIILSIGVLLMTFAFLLNDLAGFEWPSIANKNESLSLQKANLKTKMFKDVDRVENGIHVKTGLAWDKDLNIIRTNCTSCHSAKLITQNRASKEGWEEMIVWMQKTQGLHDLGKNKDVIISYLSKYYAPENKGRRVNLNLSEVDWYKLD